MKDRLLFAGVVIAAFLLTVALTSWRAGLSLHDDLPVRASAPAAPRPAHVAALRAAAAATASRPGAPRPENDPQSTAAASPAADSSSAPTTTEEFLFERDTAAARSSRSR